MNKTEPSKRFSIRHTNSSSIIENISRPSNSNNNVLSSSPSNVKTIKKLTMLSDGFDFDPLSSPNISNNLSQVSSSDSSFLDLPSKRRTSNASIKSLQSVEDVSDFKVITEEKHGNEHGHGLERESKINHGNEPLITEDEDKIKEASQLAAVFLEMRDSILSNHNIDTNQNSRAGFDTSGMADTALPFHRPIGRGAHSSRISRTTVQRAERIKAMMNLYYFSLFQCQKSTDVKHPMVDGVYNPLQIIRNRQVKMQIQDKYHIKESAALNIRVIPYASTAFSQNNKRKGHFKWEVELQERAREFVWRAQHMEELRDPKGKLWYPPASNHALNHSKRLQHRRTHDDNEDVHHIHDKLFDLVDDDVKEDASFADTELDEDENDSISNSYHYSKEANTNSNSRKELEGDEDRRLSSEVGSVASMGNSNDINLPEIKARSRSKSRSNDDLTSVNRFSKRTIERFINSDKHRRTRSKSPFKKLLLSSGTSNGNVTQLVAPGLITPLNESLSFDSRNMSFSSLEYHHFDNAQEEEDDGEEENEEDDEEGEYSSKGYEQFFDENNDEENGAEDEKTYVFNNFFDGITIEPIKQQQQPSAPEKSVTDDDFTESESSTNCGAITEPTKVPANVSSSGNGSKMLFDYEENAAYELRMAKYYKKLMNLSDLLDVSDNFFQIKTIQYQTKVRQVEMLENRMNNDLDLFIDNHPTKSRRPSVISMSSPSALQQQQQQHAQGSLSFQTLGQYETLLNEMNSNLERYKSNSILSISTDLDKYLSNSDRNIGEITTTLGLELRKLNEKFEKISYLFKSYNFKVQGEIIRKERQKLRERFAGSSGGAPSEEGEHTENGSSGADKASSKGSNVMGLLASKLSEGPLELDTLYWLLEKLVVVVLWIIWFVFWLVKIVKTIVWAIWQTLKWFLS